MKFIFIYILAIIMLLSCKRDNKSGYIGPEFVTAPAGFTATSFAALPDLPSTVNFAVAGTKVTFTATFSARVTYQITLTGINSGAKKTLSATGWDPTGVSWDGGHDGLYYFRSGEQVEAKITFFSSDIILRDTVQITGGGTKPFGVLINSYETNGGPLFSGRGTFEGRYPKLPSDPGFDEVIYGDTSSSIRPVEGAKVFTLDGNDLDGNYYLMSALQNNIYMVQLGLTTVKAEDLYFNIYVYSHGIPGSRMSINFIEHDSYDINNPFDPSNPHTVNFTEDINDVYKYILVLPDKEGWYLYSVKYSEIPLSSDANEGMNGNRVREPEKLVGINIIHLALQPGIHSKLSVDNARFTVGKPLTPIE